MQPTARCARSVLEGCGGVAAERHEQLLEVVGGLLTNSQKKKEDVGEKGFQRTPAFLLAVIKRALSDPGSKEPIHARGGYTDVGQHTGSEPRDTCWPLTRDTIKVGAACLGGTSTCCSCLHHRLHTAPVRL